MADGGDGVPGAPLSLIGVFFYCVDGFSLSLSL